MQVDYNLNNILNPFINRLGGKYRQIKHLKAIFPNNCDVYIEPFLGSGVVLLNYHGAKSYIANDKDVMLYNFHKSIMEINPEIIESKDWDYSEARFRYLSKLYNGYLSNPRTKDLDIKLDGANLVLMMRYLNYYGTLGDIHTPINFASLSKNKETLIAESGKISKKVRLPLKNYYIHRDIFLKKNVQLYNLDYLDFFKMLLEKGYFNDNQKYLIYLDPPYTMKANNDRYANNNIDFKTLGAYLNLFNLPNIFWVLSVPNNDMEILKPILKEGYAKTMNLKQKIIKKIESSQNARKKEDQESVQKDEYIIWKPYEKKHNFN